MPTTAAGNAQLHTASGEVTGGAEAGSFADERYPTQIGDNEICESP